MRSKRSLVAALAVMGACNLAPIAAQEGAGLDPIHRLFGAMGRTQEIPLMVVTPAQASGMDRRAVCWAPSLSPDSPVPCQFTGTAPPVLGYAKAIRFDVGDDGSLRVLSHRDLDSKSRRLHLHQTLAALYLDQMLAYAGRSSPGRMDQLLGPEDQLGVQLWSRQIYEAAGGEMSSAVVDCPSCPPQVNCPAQVPTVNAGPDPTVLACRRVLKQSRSALETWADVVDHIEGASGGPGHHDETISGLASAAAVDAINGYFKGHPLVPQEYK